MARSPSQTTVLEKAVNTAFLHAGFTFADLGQGQINLTDLPWQNPPLFCLSNLLGINLVTYLERPVEIKEDQIFEFWRANLGRLYYTPLQAIDREGIYSGSNKLLPGESKPSNRFRFSTPEGFPKSIDEYAGAVFSMELATLISESLPYYLIRDDSNYYVTLPNNVNIGIKDGIVATESPWDGSVAGIVWDLAEMPRGVVRTDCQYDALAKVRSLLHENAGRFKEFQGVDYALQALRVLYNHKSECSILSRAIKLKHEEPNLLFDYKALKSSLATMERKDISDRYKLDIIYGLLVPQTLSEAKYRAKIYRSRFEAPFTLSDKTIHRIISNLETELERLPVAVKGDL